jgi:hypothetical protein
MVNIYMNRKSTNEQKQKAEELGRSSVKLFMFSRKWCSSQQQFYSLLVFFLGHGRKKKSNPPYAVPFLISASLGTVTLHPVQCFKSVVAVYGMLSSCSGTMWRHGEMMNEIAEIWPKERLCPH